MIDTDDRCALTELPKSGCAHCRGHVERPTGHGAPRRITETELLGDDDYGMPFTGRFDGHCAVCGERTYEGDVIARLTDGAGYACSRHLP